MIRFRNPGTQYTTQVQVFRELYKEYKDAPSFDLDDMAATIAKTKLMTAYGYAGDAALALSNTENDSLNSTKMNAKMYAEVFRLLGWVTSAGDNSYPLVFTYIGEHAALADDVLPLYEQCVLGINNPQEIMDVKYDEKVRFFKATLFSLQDLGGIMYKHELCLGPMSIDDLDKSQYNRMITYLKKLRGSYGRYQDAYQALCDDLGVKPTLPDNSTRLPIAFMKTCGWVESQRTRKLYPPKSLECLCLTQHGADLANSLREVKDLRMDEYYSYPEHTRNSLIRLGVYSMLLRAGYDTSPVQETMRQDQVVCADVLNGKELLFSPYQTLHRSVVDEALGIHREIAGTQTHTDVLPDIKRTDANVMMYFIKGGLLHRKLHHDCGSFVANEKTVMTKGGMPLVQTAPSTSIPMKGAYLYGIDLYKMRGLLHSGYCPVGHEGIPYRQVWPDAPHIPEGATPRSLQPACPYGKAVPPSGGNRHSLS